MPMKMVYRPEKGVCERVIRDDAVKILVGPNRYYVPTQSGVTKWVETWDEFKAAGGWVGFSEDQTEIELLLPEPYKFSCKFMDQQEGGK